MSNKSTRARNASKVGESRCVLVVYMSNFNWENGPNRSTEMSLSFSLLNNMLCHVINYGVKCLDHNKVKRFLSCKNDKWYKI